MIRQLTDTYRRLEEARPLVRPAYNPLEEKYLPPYGDPEVDIPGEVWTYVVVGVALDTAIELLDET